MKLAYVSGNAATIIIPVIALAILAAALFFAATAIMRWAKNNRAPIVRVQARILDRRIEYAAPQRGVYVAPMIATRRRVTPQQAAESATYCVRFLLIDDRGETSEEFTVSAHDYGRALPGDEGVLTHQGTRYIGFEREK